MKNPIDRRRDLPRLERHMTATVVVGRRSNPCLVENTSPGGAGLQIDADVLLPPQFQLLLNRRQVDVTMAWRRDDRVGVFFTSAWRAA